MYEYPFGNGQQLNLDWFLTEWKNLLAAWEAEKNGIEGALQAEIDRAEAALADVFAARDAAAQSASDADASEHAAAQSASDASGYLSTVQQNATAAQDAARNAAQSESNAADSAQTAVASKNAAGQSERNAAQSEANADASKRAAAQSASDADASKSAAADSQTAAGQSASAAAQSAEDAEDAAASVEASAQQITTNTNDISNLKESITNIDNQLPENTITGYMPTIYDGAENIPIVSSNITVNCTVIGKSLPYDVLQGKTVDENGAVTNDSFYNVYIVNTEGMTDMVVSAYRTASGYRYLKAFGYNEDETTITQIHLGDGNPQFGFLHFFNAEGFHHIKLSWASNLNKIVFSNIYKTYTNQEIIKTFKGENTFARSGLNYNITYKCDIAEYVKNSFKLVAKVLNDMIADTALVENDFRIVNNTLYRVTIPIASGGILTVGTNVVTTTVAEVLKSLLN